MHQTAETANIPYPIPVGETQLYIKFTIICFCILQIPVMFQNKTVHGAKAVSLRSADPINTESERMCGPFMGWELVFATCGVFFELFEFGLNVEFFQKLFFLFWN